MSSEFAGFPYDTAPRYLIFDGDSNFSAAVVRFINRGYKASAYVLSQPLAVHHMSHLPGVRIFPDEWS